MERMCGCELSLDRAAVKLLMRHSAWALSCFQRGPDAATAYEGLYQISYRAEMACFGEYLLYKPHKMSGPAQKFFSRRQDGVWLGVNTRTGESMVGGDGVGVIHCRSIRRRPVEERWNGAKLLELRGTPWNPPRGCRWLSRTTWRRPLRCRNGAKRSCDASASRSAS